MKVKTLQEELRIAKEKNLKLTQQNNTIERNSKM